MKRYPGILLIFLAFTVATYGAKDKEHEWLVGRILDEGRARHFVGTMHNSSSSTTTSGSVDATARSTSIGSTTNTNLNGSYSEQSNTNTSGFSAPLYRVYDNLVLEGADMVYVTSERIRWRWSKGAHVSVNGEVKYYVDRRKLHILDLDGKEHTVEILKQIKKAATPEYAATTDSRSSTPDRAAPSQTGPLEQTAAAEVSVSIDSAPSYADIEIDGSFVGNTPSTLSLTPGDHVIRVTKKGFQPYEKTLRVNGGKINLNAQLDTLRQ
jgi:hypothetical protein